MGIRIEFNEGEYLSGLSDVTEKLQEKVNDLKKKSVLGLKDALIYVASESQQKAPVEFGDLRGSVLVEIDDVKITDLEHADYVFFSNEDGRRKTAKA